MELEFERDRQPLAARMRPRTLREFFGQKHILDEGRLLRRAIEADQLQSIILSGPPGTGKTTLARVIAERTQSQFISINAVLSGVKDIRQAIETARDFAGRTNRRTLLFVDEVHRWNRSQQDALLPWVESGLLVLIGATTENPYFEVNRALLSRSRVFLLTPLSRTDLEQVIDATLADRERGYGQFQVKITEEAREHLITTASGDARTLLNALELAVETSLDTYPPPPDTELTITLEIAEDSIQRRAVLYDKDGDYHFDTISAFIKSVRGSDPDAALYWLARMITAGEDPHYIFRRLLISAAEDVGLADPNAVSLVYSCAAAFDRIGMPEGQFHLTQATLYCAAARKSNSTLGYFDALKAVQSAHNDEVPDHLRDASRDGDELGHGRGYQYPHAYRDHWVAQQYLPDTLQGTVFYQPGSQGWEGSRRSILAERRQLQLAVEREQSSPISAAPPLRAPGTRWLNRVDQRALDEATALRDQVMAELAPVPSDRILLYGTMIQLFVWEAARRTPAGLTAAWLLDDADYQAIHHLLLHSPLSDPERPLVEQVRHPGAIPRAPSYGGPFDRILYRPPPQQDQSRHDHAATIQSLLNVLDENGILLAMEAIPCEGSRPSTILNLSPEQAALVEAAETAVFPNPEQTWRSAVQRLEGTRASVLGMGRVRTSSVRSLPSGSIASWLAETEPLGKALRNSTDRGNLEAILAAAASVRTTAIPWQRTFLTIRLSRSRS